MPTITTVNKVRVYDNIGGTDANPVRAISYSTQLVGTGDSVGLSGGLVTATVLPGTINDTDAYIRTDLTTLPTEIQNIAGVCWDNANADSAIHTAYEAYLRAQ